MLGLSPITTEMATDAEQGVKSEPCHEQGTVLPGVILYIWRLWACDKAGPKEQRTERLVRVVQSLHLHQGSPVV